MEEEKKEDYIVDCPKPISFDCTEIIINQMKKNICKIKIEEKQNQGTGFFCKIPFPDQNNMLKVLITNNHIINEEILYKDNQEISIFIKEEKEMRKLNLNDRIKYTNDKKIYDITIIEIKEEDEINNYLELDENLLNDILKNENENDNYIDKTLYIIQYPEGELSVSYGIMSVIYSDKKYKFIHKCSTKEGSSGSPILTLKNKIIGIHTGGNKSHNFGTFLNYPIKDFIRQNLNKNNDDNNNIIDEKINEIFLEEINNKFKLDIKNEKIINYQPIKKYLGDDGYKDLKELYFYYKNKIQSSFFDSDFLEKVLLQMEKCVCKIKTKELQATGFLCKIPFPDTNNMIKVLITNNHVINESITKIIIEISKDNYIKELNLNNRTKYSNREYDITIIEIKKEDEIKDYLELDDNILNNIIYNKNEIEEYKDNGIYMIQYPEGDLSLSFGIIESEEKERGIFTYFCSTSQGSSGSPIIAFNKKVIGMLLSRKKYTNLKSAQFLYNPIKDFIEKIYNNRYIPIYKKQIVFDNLIKKKIGPEIFKKLDKLYSNYNSCVYNPFRKSFIKIDQCKNIIKQIDNYVYKIKIENKETFGFFCQIPKPNKNITIYSLITNNSIINEKDAKILIEFPKEKKIKEIILTNRKKYSSKKYNTTIIEIKKEDQINNFLELEEQMIDEIENQANFDYYLDKNIYMINYKIGKFIVTFSYLRNINMLNNNFIFELNKNNLTNGAPIFLSNNKLIGIIDNVEKNCRYTGCIVGIFLSFPIKEFIEKTNY